MTMGSFRETEFDVVRNADVAIAALAYKRILESGEDVTTVDMTK